MNSNRSCAGSKPEDELVQSKSPSAVRGMFAAISPTYDQLNHAFSLNIDKAWRRTLARKVIQKDKSPQLILDVCGGTGDLTVALGKQAQSLNLSTRVICSDFTPEMTRIAKNKFERYGEKGTRLIPFVADTTRLPFPDNTFDVVTVAFGIRNVYDPLVGLKEMARVCKPDGIVAVLEFSKTRSAIIDKGFALYFTHILPTIGRWVTGTRAYSYLSKSVEHFPEGQEFCNLMTEATGSSTDQKKLSFGIATLYTSTKKQAAENQ